MRWEMENFKRASRALGARRMCRLCFNTDAAIFLVDISYLDKLVVPVSMYGQPGLYPSRPCFVEFDFGDGGDNRRRLFRLVE